LHRRITASGQAGLMRRRLARGPAPRSGFAGFRFLPEVIMVAVRWYLRYGLSYRDVEELLAERGVTVDHVTIYSVGAAVHPVADRRGTTLPAREG
jgi:transposase-like protein